MIKKLSLILVAMLIFAGQALQAQEMKAKSASTDAQNVTTEQDIVTVDNFHDKAAALVGQEVEVQGMVTHVCKHGGKKLFLNTNKEDINVKITTGDDIAAFSTELEGNTVWVRGIVEMMEVEIEAPADESAERHEEDEAHKNIYHKKQYSIKALKYKVVE